MILDSLLLEVFWTICLCCQREFLTPRVSHIDRGVPDRRAHDDSHAEVTAVRTVDHSVLHGFVAYIGQQSE
jgi:hypothetical protein